MKQLAFLLVFQLFIITQIEAQFSYQSKIAELFGDDFVGVTKIDHKDHFQESYELFIKQPLDHNDPSKGSFNQRIFIAHTGLDRPTLLVTEGYSARQVTYELAKMLYSNQIIVEYRFNGKSVPDKMDYQYLTNEQAIEDIHRIRKVMGKFYKAKWASTGISKGGTTCLMYKATYPRDVKVAIPYVAPMPDAREDQRMDRLLSEVGTEECRNKLFAFQKACLAQSDQIVPMVDSLGKADKLSFSIGVGKAFEYCVLESTFSFWQYVHDCSNVPVNASPKENFAYLLEIVGFDFYADATIDYFSPAFYQFMTENGYYGFMNDHLKDQIQYVDQFDNEIFGPKNTKLSYRPAYMKSIKERLKRKGKRIIQIQGAYDPWAACGMDIKKRSNGYFVKEAGGHTTRIKDLPEDDQSQIMSMLGKYLKTTIRAAS